METFERDGLRFDVDDSAPTSGASDAPLVVLLHGFPQTRESWEPLATRLVAEGYRVLVPDQRGYSPGARPRRRRDYVLGELAADVAELIRWSGAPGRAHVVGHDWGALVAWALAAAHPDLVASVTGVSVPHPVAFLRAIAKGRQAIMSWYVGVFQIPGIERLLARPGVLENVLRRAGQSAEAARRDVTALRERGDLADVLRGALCWYRAVPLLDPRPGRVPTTRPVSSPALMVWSDGDVAISRRAADGNAALMTGYHRYEILPGVSHWIPDEAPEALATLVQGHLAQARDMPG